MKWVLLVGVVLALVGGLIASLTGHPTKRARNRAIAEVGILATLSVLGVGLLVYFPGESWALGIATGFFSISVYDLLRSITRVLE
jgi:hypothetical protein